MTEKPTAVLAREHLNRLEMECMAWMDECPEPNSSAQDAKETVHAAIDYLRDMATDHERLRKRLSTVQRVREFGIGEAVMVDDYAGIVISRTPSCVWVRLWLSMGPGVPAHEMEKRVSPSRLSPVSTEDRLVEWTRKMKAAGHERWPDFVPRGCAKATIEGR